MICFSSFQNFSSIIYLDKKRVKKKIYILNSKKKTCKNFISNCLIFNLVVDLIRD